MVAAWLKLIVAFLYVAVLTAISSGDVNRLGSVVARISADKTFIISPTSFNVALHIAEAGSSGQTAREIRPLLLPIEPQSSSVAVAGDVQTSSATKIWISKRFHSRPAFERIARETYGAAIARVDFANGQGERDIASWLADSSKGVITSAPFSAETLAVVANVSTFHATWKRQFDPKLTTEAPFQGKRGRENAHLMLTARVLSYREDRYGKTVALDYAWPYRMILFLPGKESANPLATFLESGINAPLRNRYVEVYLPRVHAKSRVNLVTAAEELGIRTAFSPDADFSTLLGVSHVPLSVFFQDASLSIDERGTSAVTATEFSAAEEGVPLATPPPKIRFDRPFAFAIVRSDEGRVLFEGQILDIEP